MEYVVVIYLPKFFSPNNNTEWYQIVNQYLELLRNNTWNERKKTMPSAEGNEQCVSFVFFSN